MLRAKLQSEHAATQQALATAATAQTQASAAAAEAKRAEAAHVVLAESKAASEAAQLSAEAAAAAATAAQQKAEARLVVEAACTQEAKEQSERLEAKLKTAQADLIAVQRREKEATEHAMQTGPLREQVAELKSQLAGMSLEVAKGELALQAARQEAALERHKVHLSRLVPMADI